MVGEKLQLESEGEGERRVQGIGRDVFKLLGGEQNYERTTEYIY